MPNPSPTTNGTINSVRCPLCGKPNDFRDIQSQQLLDTGNVVDCDHCHQLMEIVAIRPMTVVTVRQASRGARVTRVRQVGPAPRQATTLTPSQTRKLLKGG
jgi:hypothetical protein